jgi:ArsR family transcriptional regulator
MTNIDVSCCAPVAGGLDEVQALELSELLKVLADPARLRIVSMLATGEADEVCVCDMTAPLGLSQPTVSHHIKVLREAGFITSERRSKWVYHRLVPEQLEAVCAALSVGSPV